MTTVFLSLLFISMYAGFCFGVGGFPVKECKTANSASILNFLRTSINLAADGVEPAAALLLPSELLIIIVSPRLTLEYYYIVIIPKVVRV